MESSTIEQTPDMEQKFLNAIAGNAHYAAAVRECVKVHESALQPLRDELERVKGERDRMQQAMEVAREGLIDMIHVTNPLIRNPLPEIDAERSKAYDCLFLCNDLRKPVPNKS
jgi:hypothetical protein